MNSQQCPDDGLPALVLSRLEKVPLKDFVHEVRAIMDLEKFLKEAVLILDEEDNNLESIIEKMLRQVISQDIQSDDAEAAPEEEWIMEAKNAIFMQITCFPYSYQRIAKTIKGISLLENEGLMTDQTWICAMCSLASVNRRHVAVTRLKTPLNLGRSSEGVYFIILVITPTKEKGTKSDIEISRTFATLFSDLDFRQKLLRVDTEDAFKTMLNERAVMLTAKQRTRKRSLRTSEVMHREFSYEKGWPICNGIRSDLKKRLPLYPSDFRDGYQGKNTIRKVISATVFIYFVCLLPSIAFGALNDHITHGKIVVQSVIISQTFGGLFYAIFSGQPLVILLTTAPLALYTKVIYMICEQYEVEFYAMFGWIGVFNSAFLFLYAIFDMSRIMRWSTRSTEETFAFFISIAFFVDASRDVHSVFIKHYSGGGCDNLNDTLANITTPLLNSEIDCRKETSVLFLLLFIGTVWLSVSLFNFTKTPYLNFSKREVIADFALPVAVIVMSVIGSYAFREIKLDTFNVRRPEEFQMTIVNFAGLPYMGILGAVGLAFPLSLLFFMDQNISGAMVNSPSNKLKKGSSYNWDIVVVAVINLFLSLFGLPWVHGALPHSPLHVKALADMEERVDLGNNVKQKIVWVRETRITGIVAHVLIGFTFLMIPIPLVYIPIAVLDGLFIYMAITALYDNQLFERILLLLTEQAAYPPSHYLRRVPQRKVHIFTILQLLQLGLLCAFGFAPTPYMKMGFPILLILQLPIRHWLLPKVIPDEYLEALDKPI